MQLDNLKYVSLQPVEITEGKKHFLYIEMEMLTAIQKYEIYKKLRKQELSLKNLLKKTIGQIKEELEKLDTFLPKIPVERPRAINLMNPQITPAMLSKMKLIKAPPAKRDILEEQIEELQRKIADLG